MKITLYPKETSDYSSNGIGTLYDAVDSTVHEVLKGRFEAELKYPVNGIHFADIDHRSIILAKPNPVSNPQPFYIYRRTKAVNGVVTFYARHKAYNLDGIVVSPYSAVGVEAALQGLKSNAAPNCPFEFWTDLESNSKFELTTPKNIWALLGNGKGSFVDTFGGEPEFDGSTVKLWKRRGSNRGVSIRFRKNLIDGSEERNWADCYTGVYPYWKNSAGDYMELPEKVYYAIGNFGYSRVKELDLSSVWATKPTESQIRSYLLEYCEGGGIAVPTETIKVQYIDLGKTVEFFGRVPDEPVLLGDTVSVTMDETGAESAARVTETRYKPLLDRYESITVGKVRSISDVITSAIGKTTSSVGISKNILWWK